MSKILLAGAGGVPTENVIRSIAECDKEENIVGMGSESSDLVLSLAKKKYLVPYANDEKYESILVSLLNIEKPDLIHFQNDVEILKASKIRGKILETGVKLFMPPHQVIEDCVDKSRSAAIWEKEGIQIPKTLSIMSKRDLKIAFDILGDSNGMIWLRTNVGGGGRGALPTNDFEFASRWIDRFNGWGEFTGAELLTEKTVTWLSIWHEGELVVAQTRRRRSWNLGDRTLSGVTGVTKVGETYSSEAVNRIAIDSIRAIDKRPHGIYGVDMTYNQQGVPNPTEINISRFFTTVHFFTEAGLNMPKIFKDIALYDEFPSLEKKVNPLKDGLLWVRAMDRAPLLTTEDEMVGSLLSV